MHAFVLSPAKFSNLTSIIHFLFLLFDIYLFALLVCVLFLNLINVSGIVNFMINSS